MDPIHDVPFEKRYYTPGHLCQMFQRPLGEITAILRAAGVKPELSVNDVPHYGAQALIVMGRFAREAERDGN